MKTEITSNIDTESTESKGLTLKRARVEQTTAERELVDYPAGIILTD